MTIINKNRNREDFSFANINLLGNCNANCYFCLGKDIQTELNGKNQLNTHFTEWENFNEFLDKCTKNGIKKLYITGQTADGLQYKYLEELVDHLQWHGYIIGVRTNGYLARHKMPIIKKMLGGIGYSIHTLRPQTNEIIMGIPAIPDWDTIIPASGPNVRVSIVVNRYNWREIDDIIKYISKFDNVRYIQLRRISTDTRLSLLEQDIDAYESYFETFKLMYGEPDRHFFLAETYDNIYGKEINFWRTVETSCNSMNYFTDGTISDEYFIVEGYLKNKN